MITFRTEINNALAAGSTTFVYCARIVRTDGVSLYWTSHVNDLLMNSNLYKSDSGYAPSAATTNVNLDPEDVDVDLILGEMGADREDVRNGLYDDSRLFCFMTLWDDPVEDDVELLSGFWGKVELERSRLTARFNANSNRLDQKVARQYMAACPATLGDTACGAPLSPATWIALTAYTESPQGDLKTGDIVKPTTQSGLWFKCIVSGTSGASEPSWSTGLGNPTSDGTASWETIQALSLDYTVKSVTSQFVFDVTAVTEAVPADWFGGGLVTWLTGDNAGLSIEIKTQDAAVDPEFTLQLPMPYSIQVGDTFTATAGCRKRFTEDCSNKFNNPTNYRGFPNIPSSDQTTRIGGQ